MIERIRGILVQKTPTFVVVECAGVGYGVNISASTAGKLPEEGAEVTLHTNLVVREDSMTLFGFADTTEKDLFLMFLSVNGIGLATTRLPSAKSRGLAKRHASR